MMLSVILLTYNHAPYIEQAVLSAIDQNTSFEYEILIGDDCSTDGTSVIVDRLQLKYPNRIKVLRPQKNEGAIKNEKRLMEASKGKYIAFLEGDDFWTDPLKLQKQVDFLEANSEFGMVHSDVNHYYQNKQKMEYFVNRTNNIIVQEGHIFFEILKPEPLFIKTATVCFRKNLIQHFDYELAINDNWPLTDMPLWLDISYNSKVHYFNEVFATYRLLNESASRITSPLKKLQFHNGLFKIKQHYLKKYNCDNNLKQKIEEEYFRSLIRIGFSLKDKKETERAFNFLKNNNLNISIKERLIFISNQNKFLQTVIKQIKN